jgi:hypothetical protein
MDARILSIRKVDDAAVQPRHWSRAGDNGRAPPKPKKVITYRHPLICQSAGRLTPGAMLAISQLDALKKEALPGS